MLHGTRVTLPHKLHREPFERRAAMAIKRERVFQQSNGIVGVAKPKLEFCQIGHRSCTTNVITRNQLRATSGQPSHFKVRAIAHRKTGLRKQQGALMIKRVNGRE